MTQPMMRATFSQRGDDIHGTVELPGDGVFTLECLSLIVGELAKKVQVPPLEIVQDLYSLIAKQSMEVVP